MLYDLVCLGIEGVVDTDYSADMSNANKARIAKHDYHTILLYLSDDVLSFVAHMKTTAELCKELETNYLESDIPNIIISLNKQFSFRFTSNKTVSENLVVFKRLVYDINNITKKAERLNDEYLAIVLLHALPEIHSVEREFISFNKDILTTKDIIDALNFRSVGEKVIKMENEGLSIKAKSSNNKHKGKGKKPQRNNGNKN